MSGSKRRVAVGGFQHETNTFAPSKATYRDFLTASGWPGLARGVGLFEAVAGINIPISGFVEAGRELDYDLLPLTWASATPSAEVTEDAYERIVAMILEDLGSLGRIDALYLDLHGAMVTEHLEDGEGELLRRLRHRLGAEVPIVASLDLHANVTPAIVALSDALDTYRTYPHVDMAATGARVARRLHHLLDGRAGRAKAFRQIPFLIPVTSGCTLVEPAKGLYRLLEGLEASVKDASLSFACGFSPADIWDCGPSVVAYAHDQAEAERLAHSLSDEIVGREHDFAPRIWRIEEAVAHARANWRSGAGPIILADSQDNPGGGADGDGVGILAELVRQDAQGAAVALVYDPQAAEAAHAAGEGTEVAIALGAKTRLDGTEPLRARFRVERLGDGRFTGTGPFYLGARMELGPMALLRIGGVAVLVASRKLQAADQAIFRHLGLEPAEQRILALKSSVHFRADFGPLAAEILVVAAPGPNLLDHRALSYRRLRPEVRIMPGEAIEARKLVPGLHMDRG
ncbi:MAG: M81 family metallopeptidase [Kiloniellales bacterium]